MPDSAVMLALRTLRCNFQGELRCDERQQRVKYIVGPDTGQLIVPADADMLEALDTVLFIPEERDGAMELLLTLAPLTQLADHEALADRWRTYHGEPETPSWAACSIDAARHDGFVIDGEAMMQPNPLAAAEPKLCKMLNTAGRDVLAAIVAKKSHRTLEAPLAVGVDSLGIDVRARFEIVRIPAPQQQFQSAEDAERTIAQWIEEART